MIMLLTYVMQEDTKSMYVKLETSLIDYPIFIRHLFIRCECKFDDLVPPVTDHHKKEQDIMREI